MTVFPNLSGTRDSLQDSVSHLALASAEVQEYTTDISAQVKHILETSNAANDNTAPTTSLQEAA